MNDQETLLNEESDVNQSDIVPNADSNSTDSNDEQSVTEEDLNSLSDEDFAKWLDSNEVIHPDEKPNDTETQQPEKQQDTQDQQQQQEEPNYKALWELVSKPFKANGKEIVPRNVQDIIQLMQQGANYTKKMQVLAPVRKQALLLQQEGIDTNTLNFLIDLKNGNRDAIKKLLKDNKIDITDIDLDEESTYQTTGHNVSDSQLEFQDAIDDAQKNLGKIHEILNSWDSESRNMIFSNPTFLRALNWEIETGRYEQIAKILESERTFGRYKGVNDLNAFVDIARKIEENQRQAYMQQMQQANASKSKQTNRDSKSAFDKSKAAPNKSKKPTSSRNTLTPQDLLDMSDEEFLKLKESDLY